MAYLELSPGLGNVWYRLDSNNNRRFMLKGLIGVICYPFKNYTLWYPNNWDLNIFMYIIFINSII